MGCVESIRPLSVARDRALSPTTGRTLSANGATFCAVRRMNQMAVATSATSKAMAITRPVCRRVGDTAGVPVTGVGAVEKSSASSGAGLPNDEPNDDERR